MKKSIFLFFLIGAPLVQADVYKSTDGSGVTVFSDRPSKGAAKLDVPAAPAGPSRKIVPESAKPIEPISEKDAVAEKRKELQNDLDSQLGKLDEARTDLKKAQELISGTERNSQGDVDRTAAIEDEIAKREKAIEDLRKRISDLK